MQQLLRLFFVASLFLATACSKDDEGGSATQPSSSYRIYGVTDVTLEKLFYGPDSHESEIRLEHESGDQERVVLSIEGVPVGIKQSVSVLAGYPTFNSRLSLADSGAEIGTYPIKLVASGERSGRREFLFDLRVAAEIDCSAPFLGTWTASSFCNPSPFAVTVAPHPSIPNRILVSNINNAGLQLGVQIVCATSTTSIQIKIPQQNIGGPVYSGTGTYTIAGSQVSVALNVQRTVGSNTTSCTYSLTR